MTSFQISQLKEFMACLLAGHCFHCFDVVEATITTFNTFHVDGRIRKEFYEADEIEEEGIGTFSKWEKVQPICYDLIKGKRTPLSFKIVLRLSDDEKQNVIRENELTYMAESIGDFVLTIRYENGHAELVSACSMNTFVPDKAADKAWDLYMQRFLSENNIQTN